MPNADVPPKGQPAAPQYQPRPQDSCQTHDPDEPVELDVMVHNKPQIGGAPSAAPDRRDFRLAPLGRDDDEDVDSEATLEREAERGSKRA